MWLISNGTAKMKLRILAFLYCREFAKIIMVKLRKEMATVCKVDINGNVHNFVHS